MKLIHNSIKFNKIIARVVFSDFFIILTVIGNFIIGSFSFAFYQLEKGMNNSVQGLLDAFWWGFATATTVGYGDITPVTSEGKVLGIILMLVGTALFAMYTALFAEAILSQEKT